MKIFIDTEFTNFDECYLISIGLVAEDGREFYAESYDYPYDACSQFVKSVVLPLLKKYPKRIEATEYRIANELRDWLEPYRNEKEVVICYDYTTDWNLMRKLFDLLDPTERPDFLTTENINSKRDAVMIDLYWEQTGLPQHHALYDARANKMAYMK